MNVHAVLAAKGAIPNVCLLVGVWGWAHGNFAPKVLFINSDRISGKQSLGNCFIKLTRSEKTEIEIKSYRIKRSESLFLPNTPLLWLFCSAQLICFSFYHHAHCAQMGMGEV